MMTLQEIALLKNTENINSLRDLLSFCSRNQRFQNACIQSENFWKESLARIMGNIIVAQRGDLKGEKIWYEFVQSLAMGITFKYRMRYDALNDDWTKKPESWYLDLNNIEEDDIYYYPIEVPGIIPTPGSKGYFVNFSLENDAINRNENNFFLHEDEDKAFENAIKFVGESYHHMIFQLLQRLIWLGVQSEVKISSDIDNRLWEEEENKNYPSQPLPPANFFVKMIEEGNQPIVLTYESGNKKGFIYTEFYWHIETISF